MGKPGAGAIAEILEMFVHKLEESMYRNLVEDFGWQEAEARKLVEQANEEADALVAYIIMNYPDSPSSPRST